MRRCSLFLVLLLAGTAPAAAETALLSGSPDRGKAMHAAHCRSCHDARVYTRANRRVNSLGGLIKQVDVCNRQLRKELSRDQLNDLVAYLNEAYYRFE